MVPPCISVIAAPCPADILAAPMRRRELLAALPAAAALPLGPLIAAPAQAQPQPVGPAAVDAVVRQRAQQLAAYAYLAPSRDLPRELDTLDYDAYRDLRYRPDRALWAGTGLPFQLQMFHRGGGFRERVDLFEVAGGQIQPIAYATDLFNFGPRVTPPQPDPTLGFAGFRIHAPLNVPGRYDEVGVFLGASYFRAVAAGEVYGLSARALAIGAGEAGEEFPAFRAFYIERPAAGATSLVIHALLDSQSLSGAYRFVVTPGAVTTFEVSASLFPRVAVERAGLAPLTSMYLFGADQPRRFDDFRPEVHDSDGLLIANGMGERLWRPLANPREVQASAFLDAAPRGYGLMQRQRAFGAYQDLEADYHRRPSAWVQPLTGFESGDVRLSELPASDEGQDNIVACWRPTAPLTAGREHRLSYRVLWGDDPAPPSGLARAVLWRDGAKAPGRRLFVIDFAPLDPAAGELHADVGASAGVIDHLVVQPNAATGGVRVSFELDPQGAAVSELRARLSRAGVAVTEVWVHRWLA
jgi:glucans biosynthesis protein